MYKKFALFVLLLAPILVLMADAWVPKNDAPEAQAVTAAPSAEQATTTEQRPAPVAPSTMLPPQEAMQMADGAPMLDPIGVDPTPVATESMAASEALPASEDQASPDGVQQDMSNDDHP